MITRTNKFGRPFARIFACIALAALPLAAQQTAINGRVTDPSGAVIPNAAVSATAEDGSKIGTITNGAGLYQLPALRAQSYVLRLEAPGFTPAERTVTLLVGKTADVDIELQLATARSSVAVETNAVAIETSSSTVAGDVSPTEVSRIPLNGRNYLQLAMLVPGITSNDVTNSPLGATDNGKLQINVDGQQVTQNAAADSFGEPQYSQDAIDQFQIITNRFDATLGRSSRVQVNVQTKSGTNQFHGTLYGYFRNDAFNADDSVAHKLLPFSDQQFGGTVGGPILKDQVFFFFAYEGERQPNTIFDTPTGFSTTYSFANELRTNSYLLHTDWQLNGSNRLTLRGTGYTWAEPFNLASAAGGSSSAPSRAADSTRTSYSVLLTWNSILTPSLVNEAKIGFNHFDWLNTPLVNSQEYDLPGGITVGGPYNYPQHFIQASEQYRDDLFWLPVKPYGPQPSRDRKGANVSPDLRLFFKGAVPYSPSFNGVAQVDLSLKVSVAHQLDIQVFDGMTPVYENHLHLNFPNPESVHYTHRLDLLPGVYRVLFTADRRTSAHEIQVPERPSMGEIMRADSAPLSANRHTPFEFDGRQLDLNPNGKLAFVSVPHSGKVTWIVRRGEAVVSRSVVDTNGLAILDLASANLPPGAYRIEAITDSDSRSAPLVIQPGGAGFSLPTSLSFNANLAHSLRYAFIGHQWLLRGKIDEARRSLQASIENGATIDAEVELARADALDGQLDASRSRLRKILATHPDDFQALSVYAFVEARLQDYPVAAQLHHRALAIQDSPALRLALEKLPAQ